MRVAARAGTAALWLALAVGCDDSGEAGQPHVPAGGAGESASSGAHGGGGGEGGRGGASGSAGSAAGSGTSGVGGSGRAGSGAGSGGTGGRDGSDTGSGGSGGSAGTGSDAGQGGADDAGSGGSAAPQTSEDCSTHTETNHCLSARGELRDKAFDFTCLMDFGMLREDLTPSMAWSMRCSDPLTNTETLVVIPHRAPGPFSYVPDDEPANIRIELSNNTLSAASYRENLDDAEIEGEVRMEAATGSAIVIVGTYRASWSDSDACGDVTSCPKGSVTASFRSVFDL